jgi:hypothetical protein
MPSPSRTLALGARSGSARLVTWQELASERPELIVSTGLVAEFQSREILGRPGEEAPTAVLRLPGAIVGPVGVLFEDCLIADDAHYLPCDWQATSWSPYSATDDDRWAYSFSIGQAIPGQVLYVDTAVAVRNLSHFVREALPYGTIQADLARAGIDVAALLPQWRFASQVALASRVFTRTAFRAASWILVEELLLPPRQWRVVLDLDRKPTLRVPARALQRLARWWPELFEAQHSPPSGPPVYLWREWGYFSPEVQVEGRDFVNGSDIDDVFRGHGFELVDPTTTPIDDVIHKVASAPMIAGLHGAQMAQVLWANARSVQLELTGPDGASANHEALAEAIGITTIHLSARVRVDGRTELDLDALRRVLAAGSER